MKCGDSNKTQVRNVVASYINFGQSSEEVAEFEWPHVSNYYQLNTHRQGRTRHTVHINLSSIYVVLNHLITISSIFSDLVRGERKMGRMDYLAMKTDEDTNKLINEDFNELKLAAKKLFDHATKLGGLGFGTSFLKWFASFAAIYLLILDRTNWKTNMLTGLLVPYIFFSFPSVLFHLFRGEVGKWIAFVAVVLRLFFPRHFPDVMNAILAILEIIYKFLKKLQHSHLGTITRIVFEILLSFDWLEMPGSLILLLVVAPSLFAETIRNSWIGTVVCLLIGCYLLQEHIRASGGFRNSFTQSNGISNTVGIILLLVYPIWALVLRVV